jgi:AmmeMemoRadiSam system protein A
MWPLPEASRLAALQLARRAIEAFLRESELPAVSLADAALARPSGVFVTLHRRGRLRGCIGQIEPVEPLSSALVRCAIAAAREDPRFEPVGLAELTEIEIEVSVLSVLEPVRPEMIRVGIHGLVVTRGPCRGLLLPQVASERGWSRERFLEEACAKAGLEAHAWRDPATLLHAFAADIFSERDFASALRPPAASPEPIPGGPG